MRQKRQEQRKRPAVSEFDKKVYALFQSSTGKEVLTGLEAIFYNNSTFVQGDPHFTTYKVGQQDVIGFIKESMYLVEHEPPIIQAASGGDF